MPTCLSRPRRQLLEIQRTLARRLKGEILESFEDPALESAAYRREYERCLPRRYRKRITQHELLRRLATADIVFQGEFHTCSACQDLTLWALDGLSRRRRIVLATEVVPADAQAALDAYVAGLLDEPRFLEAIDYDSRWGFPWDRFRPILRFARDREVQAYGINGPSEAPLAVRLSVAAETIARAAIAHPDSIVYAVAGDLHVCRAHLPSLVRKALAIDGARRRILIVHQNIDEVYWDVARRGVDVDLQAVDLGQDELCVLTTSPLLKYQSYLHWELGQDVLQPCRGRRPESVLRPLVREIARSIGVDPRGLDDFAVYTPDDLGFLEDLARSGRYSASEIREVRRQILHDESYFLCRGNVIYLSNLSVESAAEEAAHYVNNKLSGHVPQPLEPQADLYLRMMKEALGYFGSKLVRPARRCHGEEDFREILARSLDAGASRSTRRLGELARLVLEHLAIEREALSGEGVARLRLAFEAPLDLHLGMAHSIGYILGEKLYQGFQAGVVQRSFVGELFHSPLVGPGEAEAAYFDLVERLNAR